MAEEVAERRRANWLGAPAFFNLNQACRILSDAFGWSIYLVGSSLTRRDYRDVDVRCILDDDEFARVFPNCSEAATWTDARWSILCTSIAEWLSSRTGLPVDFQFQSRTVANRDYGRAEHPRNALGIFVERRTPEVGDG